ncbi:MAG: phenylalanine--tRNA ligase subunit beta [Planctomycetia bacterium]|nr:phenylalanine--tRNA ligase subunit beta [Planctomycetia bacterium]
MIVSWNWLAQYVRLDMPVEVLTERLALTGLNHESTDEVGGDLAIDLEVTSNRPDCLGHLGVAREVSVLFDRPLRLPDPRPATAGEPTEALTSVAVEAPDLCPHFTARVVSGLTVRESPWWLRKRLETLGVRPVSNVVDVTNYVMFECGQPLHAYDLDRLAGRRLVVRLAREKETLRAINNKVYDLSPGMLVIADAERPVGLAGVMGGLDTEIAPGTKNVLIEAARFDPMSVRRTSRTLGLFSPSSYRFERPLDAEATEWASRRCAELILETAGGTLHPGLVEVGASRPERATVTLRLDQIPRVLGIAIDRATVERILRALGLEPAGESGTSLTFRPPSWRSDLEREIDLVEEVARVHGYEHIPEDRAVPLVSSPRGDRERVDGTVREALIGCGFDEAVTFSLVADELSVTLSPGPAVPPIRVEHSARRREGALRRSIVPSLLAARRHNEAHGNPDAELFEIADVYLPRPGAELPDQPVRLALVSGRDVSGIKGVVEALLSRLHVPGALEVRPADVPLFTPGRAAELLVLGEHLGYLGEVARDRLDALELRGSVTAAELELGVLIGRAVLVAQNRRLPEFPAVYRDLSLVVPRSLPWAELSSAVTGSAGATLEAVDFLDTFQGGNLPAAMHSVHFGLRFRNPERTLTGEEVDRLVRSVVDACAARFGATLRA